MKNKHLHYHRQPPIQFKILGVIFVIAALAAIVAIVIYWQESMKQFDRDSFPMHKILR